MNVSRRYEAAPEPRASGLPRPRYGGLRRFAREPLVHFLLIGAVMFVVGAVRGGAPDRARVIEVSADVRAGMRAIFRQRFDRDPTADELRPLLEQWVRNEVLYREAVAAGLDKGDQGLRDRLIQKMNLLVFQQSKPPQPTEAELREWFEMNRAKFDEPASVDFIAVLFDGADGEARAKDALARIAAEAEPDALHARARVYPKRPQAQVDTVFGEGFLAGLLAAPAETWTAVRGRDGWFVVRVDGVHPARPATLDQFRDNAVEGWRNDAMHALANQALGQIATHYVIRGASLPP